MSNNTWEIHHHDSSDGGWADELPSGGSSRACLLQSGSYGTCGRSSWRQQVLSLGFWLVRRTPPDLPRVLPRRLRAISARHAGCWTQNRNTLDVLDSA